MVAGRLRAHPAHPVSVLLAGPVAPDGDLVGLCDVEFVHAKIDGALVVIRIIMLDGDIGEGHAGRKAVRLGGRVLEPTTTGVMVGQDARARGVAFAVLTELFARATGVLAKALWTQVKAGHT